jgi:pimeloyl-ACP methyl ester carboxylesterase
LDELDGRAIRGTMTCIRRGYRTLGKLNAEKSNAILWPTWLGGRSEELLQFIGPGNVVDSGKYFVILVDSIGNGISTSPFNSSSQPRMKFPKFTVRDMVESEHRLVTEVLRLGHLHAVMGLSMGGMQAFEWAVVYPDFMDLTVFVAASNASRQVGVTSCPSFDFWGGPADATTIRSSSANTASRVDWNWLTTSGAGHPIAVRSCFQRSVVPVGVVAAPA